MEPRRRHRREPVAKEEPPVEWVADRVDEFMPILQNVEDASVQVHHALDNHAAILEAQLDTPMQDAYISLELGWRRVLNP